MSNPKFKIIRHIPAGFSSFLFLFILHLVQADNQGINDPTTADTPILIYGCFCNIPSIILSIVIFPLISVYFELWFILRLKLKWWQHIPVFAIIVFLGGYIFILPIIWMLGSEPTLTAVFLRSFFGAVVLAINGLVYWLVYVGATVFVGLSTEEKST